MVVTDAELVASLVEVLDRVGEEDGWDGPGVLVRSDAERVDVLPLAGQHPREVLLGHRFDPEWRAIGVLTFGWAAPVGGGRPSAHPERLRSRTAIAVGRSGDLRARCRLADGRQLDEVPEGWLVDCLLRVMDRPTAPAATGTEILFAIHWLGNMAAEARRSGGLSWEEAASLHPAMHLLAQDGMPVGADSLVAAAAALSKVCGWSEVRRQCIDKAWLADQVSPELAAWMDTGMLSRWVLERTRSIDDLLQQLSGRLTPGVARRVRRSLRELGVGSAGSDGDGVAEGQHATLPVHCDDAIGDHPA
jgi:hypothetical protein